MPLFGCHTSIKGGLPNALEEAMALGCETVQLFTKVASQWKARELPDEEVALFRQTLRKSGLRYPMVHDSYLINMASPDDTLYRKSVEAFVVELQRAERIGASFLVTHPGAYGTTDVETGLKRVAGAFDEVHRRCPGYQCKILVENTAGQGTYLASKFEQIARILELVEAPERVGVCFDTCHAFAAGYALAPKEEYEATFAEFDHLIGLERLLAFHVNDSATPKGSHVDRHAHIGKGTLGLEPFRLLLNDPRFKDLPMVLETPKEDGDNDDMDRVNLATLRSLIGSTGKKKK